MAAVRVRHEGVAVAKEHRWVPMAVEVVVERVYLVLEVPMVAITVRQLVREDVVVLQQELLGGGVVYVQALALWVCWALKRLVLVGLQVSQMLSGMAFCRGDSLGKMEARVLL